MSTLDQPLTTDAAEAIWTILVEECGAHEGDRASFIANQTTDFVSEWRFCGVLGFGGKFWRNHAFDGEWSEFRYVSCYREDRTPDRDAVIERANRRLADLVKA